MAFHRDAVADPSGPALHGLPDVFRTAALPCMDHKRQALLFRLLEEIDKILHRPGRLVSCQISAADALAQEISGRPEHGQVVLLGLMTHRADDDVGLGAKIFPPVFQAVEQGFDDLLCGKSFMGGKERCKTHFHIFHIFRRHAPDKIISGFSHAFLRLKALHWKVKFFQILLQTAASISHLELGRIYLSTELLTDE